MMDENSILSEKTASGEVGNTESVSAVKTVRVDTLRDLGIGGGDEVGIKGFWRKFFRERKYLLICFFLPALLMWMAYITIKVYPFGEESVLVLDLNGQYVYFFEALRDILGGDGSLLYSFRRALGGDFLGIIGYYIASPFSAIVALFPDEFMTEALLTMFLLKTGLCGLTFGCYIEATRPKRNRPMTVVFSTMYALTAYAVVMQHNTMWIDNLIWLPLILRGVENLILRKKYKMFVITLSLAVMSNFYIGYMMCIFVALYYFYYYYSLAPEVRNPEGKKYHLLTTTVRMGLFSVLAIAICAVFIWGSYYSLTFGKTEFTDPNFGFTQRFDYFDLISKMYFGSYDTVRPEGWPFVYCGMLTFILLPLYFFAKKVPMREKIATAFLCVAMVFSFNANPVDMFWHGLQKPNWLNYRYSFMLCFIFLIMAYKAYEEIEDIGFRKVFASAAAITGILFTLQKLGYENLPDITGVWASLGFILAYFLLLRGATWNVQNIRKTTALVLCIIVSFEMYAAGLDNLLSLDDDVVISSRTGYRNFIDKYQPVVDMVREHDDGFYRTEKMYHRKVCDNMALGMYGVSNSTSTLNSKVIDLLADYGIASKSHWSKYLGGTPVFDSLFGIKYILAEPQHTVSPLYGKVLENGGVNVYENPYAMSVAAGVNEALADLKISGDDAVSESPFGRMNATVGAMLGLTETPELFRMIPTKSSDYYDCTMTISSGHDKYVKNSDESYVLYTFVAPSDENILMYIPSDYTRECKLYINGTQKDTYFGNETCRIVDIGKFKEGEEVGVKLVLQKDNLYIKQGQDFFCTLDTELCRELLPKLNTSAFNITEHTEDTLIGTIHVLPGQELIYTSIPYDEGWKIEANGESVEIFEILGGLTAFRLTAGSYNLSMKYRPTCVTLGIKISAAGVIVFVAVWVIGYMMDKKRKKAAVAAADSEAEAAIIEGLDREIDNAAESGELDVYGEEADESVPTEIKDGGHGIGLPESDGETVEGNGGDDE